MNNFTPQDWGQMALMGGLSILGNNNGTRSVPQLLGQGGLDALSGLQFRKQYEAEMQRRKAQDAMNQQKHDLAMRQGQMQMDEATRRADLMKRWQAGDKSNEVLYGLFPEQMMQNDLLIQQEQREAQAAEAERKRKQKEYEDFLRQVGILPGTLPVSLSAPATPANGGSMPKQPVPLSPAPQAGSNGPINPYEGYDMEKVRQFAMSGGPFAAEAREILQGYNEFLKDNQKWQSDELKRRDEELKSNKQKQDIEMKAGAALDALSSAERILAESDEGWGVTGMDGLALGYAAGSPAFDLRQHVGTLKNNLGLNELQQMRQNSTTGGSGLGQVTEREHAILQNTLAALNPNMSFKEFSRNLSIVKTILGDIVNGTQTALIRDKDGKFVGLRNEYDISQGFSSGSRNAPSEWDAFYD